MINLIVYTYDSEPTKVDLLHYLSQFEELRGKNFDGMVAEFGIKSDALYKGAYFQVRDKHIHDDRVFFLILQPTVEEMGKRSVEDLWVARFKKELGDIATYWAHELRITEKVLVTVPEDTHIRIILTPSNNRLAEMSSSMRRGNMRSV